VRYLIVQVLNSYQYFIIISVIRKVNYNMNINIYYGGRGLIDDPTVFVINRIQQILGELNVKVIRYDLHDLKSTIMTLPQTLKEVDAIILATTVEWYGIGGYMQMFLDYCWQYGDKNKIGEIYMFPVVMAKTYGEREVSLTLSNSWEMLGGKPVNGLSAYVDETADFEFNSDHISIIEKFAETIYRTVTQKVKLLPSSNNTIKQSIMKDIINLTPQENEQLSKFASDETFVQTQKKDIEELSSLFKEMMNDKDNGGDDYYISSLKKSFSAVKDFSGTYMIMISDKDKNILITVEGNRISVDFGDNADADVIGKMKKEIFDNIIAGRMTFQRAFMTGDMTAKGNFKTLRMIDEIFQF